MGCWPPRSLSRSGGMKAVEEDRAEQEAGEGVQSQSLTIVLLEPRVFGSRSMVPQAGMGHVKG